MIKTKITIMLIGIITITACRTTKKSSTSPAPTAAQTTSNPYVFLRPADGINAPGNEELIAIQAQFKEVTLDKLKEGHTIYTEGACIGCHGAQNIYQIGESKWKGIIDDMAQRANISDAQKDALYKYVLSIKATQTK